MEGRQLIFRDFDLDLEMTAWRLAGEAYLGKLAVPLAMRSLIASGLLDAERLAGYLQRAPIAYRAWTDPARMDYVFKRHSNPVVAAMAAGSPYPAFRAAAYRCGSLPPELRVLLRRDPDPVVKTTVGVLGADFHGV